VPCQEDRKGQGHRAAGNRTTDGSVAIANMIKVTAPSISTPPGVFKPPPRSEVERGQQISSLGVCVEDKQTIALTTQAREKENDVAQSMIKEIFIADSGANRCVYPNAKAAYEYYGLQGEVKTASGEATKSDGVGKLKLYSHGLHPMGGFENVVFCKSCHGEASISRRTV
jgi:hypothetical protein